MEAASVDIGLQRAAFLRNSDMAVTEAATACQLWTGKPGGIILIDFMDMADPQAQRQLQRNCARVPQKDRARIAVTVSRSGLVDMTRKRTNKAPGQAVSKDCPVGEGRGPLKPAESVGHESFREMLVTAITCENDVLPVTASRLVVGRLLDEESDTRARLKERPGKKDRFAGESMCTQKQLDVVLS